MASDFVARALAFSCSTHVRPLETPELDMEPCPNPATAIEACTVMLSAKALVLRRVPPRVHNGRPLEVEISISGTYPSEATAAALARWLSVHARLSVIIHVREHPSTCVSAPVSERAIRGGLIARALIHPVSWVDATLVSVTSLSLSGQPLHFDGLPAAVYVGYNHAPAPEGTVYQAALLGDVPALQAALDAGGSTEVADGVRGGKEGAMGRGRRQMEETRFWEGSQGSSAPPIHVLQHSQSACLWAASKGHLEALRTLLAAGANPAAASKVRDV